MVMDDAGNHPAGRIRYRPADLSALPALAGCLTHYKENRKQRYSCCLQPPKRTHSIVHLYSPP